MSYTAVVSADRETSPSLSLSLSLRVCVCVCVCASTNLLNCSLLLIWVLHFGC